jgi:hypothetical protein
MKTYEFKAFLEEQNKQLREEQDVLLKYLGIIVLMQEEASVIMKRLEEIGVQLMVLRNELDNT